jgi:carbon monoxide dehydrogenase subunit G
MAIVQRSVHIKASPEETMALLSDASRWPDWYPGMTEIDIAVPFPEEGGKVTFKVKSAGIPMSITETVLEYQPGKLQLLEMDGMLSGRARWELHPEGDGTRLTTTFDYALPGGVFGKIANALIVKRMNAKSLGEGLHNLKALVERQRVVVK